MNYYDMDIKISYSNRGANNFVDTFLIPALKCTRYYKRAVGFFSSGVLGTLLPGIKEFKIRGEHIFLIASPALSEKDIEAIKTGYKEKEKVIEGAFTNFFIEEISKYEDDDLKLLSELIAIGKLDIKIAVTDSYGIYHDKLGILEDFDGNVITFYGSPNSSKNAYQDNYEKIRTAKSWIYGQSESVQDEQDEFDSIWYGQNPFIETYSFTKAANENILKVIRHRNKTKITDEEPIELRQYQKDAIEAWFKNNCHGFFVMATGTGKTWTAIYCAKRLTDNGNRLIVICAPYKHLVKQWMEDVKKVYKEAPIILISSENSTWEAELEDAILEAKYYKPQTVIAISTIKSFNLDRFHPIIQNSSMEKLLIVDEAHRFKCREQYIHESYSAILGLSATPSSKMNDAAGKELIDFFGGQVFNLPIEYAIKNKYLVEYNYHPIYVNATPDEENLFNYYTRKMSSCFNKAGICIDVKRLAEAKRSRLRVISMAQEKIQNIKGILNQIENKDHFIVYCGDGRLFEDNANEGIRHITFIQQELNAIGLKPSQFTAEEDMKTRMQRVDYFNKGMIDSLVAIRCLDEGINIPSIKSALILSSNDDYREFIQRRGRILRTYTNEYTGEEKGDADIYDVIVLPGYDMLNFAKIEFRRFYEYARLAKNRDECIAEIRSCLPLYSLDIDDISNVDEDNEEEIDE